MPLERERRESFATKALHMVAGDGSFLAQNRGSARLPEDFNCDSSTTAFEVVLTGADPDVSRAATLEVSDAHLGAVAPCAARDLLSLARSLVSRPLAPPGRRGRHCDTQVEWRRPTAHLLPGRDHRVEGDRHDGTQGLPPQPLCSATVVLPPISSSRYAPHSSHAVHVRAGQHPRVGRRIAELPEHPDADRAGRGDLRGAQGSSRLEAPRHRAASRLPRTSHPFRFACTCASAVGPWQAHAEAHLAKGVEELQEKLNRSA